jgi:3-hydroxyisobutyrate dehydrogenase-like beta-hydroxyacid dehydrogenase
VVGEDGPADAAKLLAGLLPAGTELHREEVFARAREQGISVDALFRATEDAGVRVVGAVWTGRACDGP